MEIAIGVYKTHPLKSKSVFAQEGTRSHDTRCLSCQTEHVKRKEKHLQWDPLWCSCGSWCHCRLLQSPQALFSSFLDSILKTASTCASQASHVSWRSNTNATTADYTTQRHTVGSLCYSAGPPTPHNLVGFRLGTGGIWSEQVIRTLVRRRDT